MTKCWQRSVGLAAALLAIALVHELGARALVDHGVAGALLAGGGGWGTIAAATGFLLFRLACFMGLAVLPAALMWMVWMVGRWLSRRAR